MSALVLHRAARSGWDRPGPHRGPSNFHSEDWYTSTSPCVWKLMKLETTVAIALSACLWLMKTRGFFCRAVCSVEVVLGAFMAVPPSWSEVRRCGRHVRLGFGGKNLQHRPAIAN